MNKASELREMSDEQLELTLKETKENLFRLRLRRRLNDSTLRANFAKARRLIARIKTIQQERKAVAATEAAAASA